MVPATSGGAAHKFRRWAVLIDPPDTSEAQDQRVRSSIVFPTAQKAVVTPLSDIQLIGRHLFTYPCVLTQMRNSHRIV
ncbi:hypothetical protein GCM10011498_06540 [Amylibacter cionae]|uniref:Uncharacterized protein n=1 Tax=Neptunicoccus cionae TaxID=2035344 RepID=A0A916QSS7_9RHOB|nr:hypothetical protein GCM10011498_06540 [Amylibacter cionae]